MIDWLSDQSGEQTPVLPRWRRALFEASSAHRGSAPGRYRDLPLDERLVADALNDKSHVRKRAKATEQSALALD